MPTYQYACTECGERLEVVQKFTDDPLTVCPACEGRLRKLFSPVGVVFKGSGFYKTDSRSSSSSSSGKPASTETSKPAAETSSGSGGSSESTAAAKPADKPAPASGTSSGGSSGDKVA